MEQSIDEILRSCNQCKETKSLSRFEVNYAFKDGRAKVCRDCRNKARQLRRLNTLQKGIYNPPKDRNCCLCKTIKPIEEFRKNSRELSGYGWECKKCSAKNRKEKIYKLKENSIAYDEFVKYRDEKEREYRKNNKDRINANARKRLRKKVNNPLYIVSSRLRSRLSVSLRMGGIIKSLKTFELCGCNQKELVAYIESKFTEGMSWENHGLKGWHIDHIIPCCDFDLNNPIEQAKCFHFTNMQPLWWHDNLKKRKFKKLQIVPNC